MVQKLQLLHEGKAKKVYSTNNPHELLLEFKDDATAFDGQKKGRIREKGALNLAISVLLFEYLEKENIPTHFIKKISTTEMLVKAVKIIPVEFVVRNWTAGSLAKRMGIEEGIKLKKPILELYYKNDELRDPMINEYHIEAFELAERQHIEKAKEYSFAVNDALIRLFESVGIILADFKLEFGIDSKDEVVLADEISPDSCRLWDAKTMEKLDKDRFRRDLGRIEEAYREVLKRLETRR
ncbi:MAG TPA: phosphoribosylaminoimidazolesuccinocarboxamide synthase [Peptococcaceae bacterium]|nr:MAG: Phosphoribosylaminoimidazole-succinocarboxamide synthase [Clostridia bacterium 41_269]HBT20753.1 phosphoribosylaminoimidazolesuccinocarboxamide synthase [Peptococcaceae bacterium]